MPGKNSTVNNATLIPLQFFICLLIILGLEIAAGVLGYLKRNEVCKFTFILIKWHS